MEDGGVESDQIRRACLFRDLFRRTELGKGDGSLFSNEDTTKYCLSRVRFQHRQWRYIHCGCTRDEASLKAERGKKEEERKKYVYNAKTTWLVVTSMTP
jgi:hypothetical protein